MEAKHFLYISAVKMHQLKAKDSETKPYPLLLGNIFKDFTIDNMREQFFLLTRMVLILATFQIFVDF